MGQAANNFHFDITAWDGHYDPPRDILLEVMRLAFADNPTASHWRLTLASANNQNEEGNIKKLVFYWSEPPNMVTTENPFKMDSEAAAYFARIWLRETEYGTHPDHDGHNSKGFRVYNEAWGHVDGCPYAVCAVEPCWVWHGK